MSASTSATTQAAQTNLSGDMGRKYKLLVQILTSDPRYSKALADVTKPSQHDKLSESLVSLSYPIGASLGIISALVNLEFERNAAHPSTILRANSLVSKMMGRYVRKVGLGYLQALLRDLIQGVYKKPEINMEPDPDRIVTGEDAKEAAARAIQQLTEECQRFIDKICSPLMLEEMPRELRAMAYYIADNGERWNFDYETGVLPLISGFIMLRIIVNAITLPNSYGIVEKMPDGNVRKNLTLIAKVLQKLSNGERFEPENASLMPMNDFIERNKGQLWDYLRNIHRDPQAYEGRVPFTDLNKTVTFEDLHYKTFEYKDLVFIHTLIYEHGFDLIVSLQNEVMATDNRRPVSIVSTETDFLALVGELGPPPDDGKKKLEEDKPSKDDNKKGANGKGGKASASTSAKGGKGGKPATDVSDADAAVLARRNNNLKDKTQEENEDILLNLSTQNLMKNKAIFDLKDLEAARFFYQGKPAKNGLPTFYIIFHRIKKEFLASNDKMLVHIYGTIGEAIEKPFILIVDLSWCDMHDELQAAIYKAVVSLSRLIRRSHLSNIQSVYVVHPTFKTMASIQDILNVIEPTVRDRIVKLAYDWGDLADIIEPLMIYLPVVSKKFVPLTYNLMKVSGDKKQERLMKVTNCSLLNIDPRLGSVQNEIPLGAIQELRSRKESYEIIIKYIPDTEADIQKRGEGWFIKASDDNKVATRKYMCYSDQQREVIVESILDLGVRSSSIAMTQAFEVTKINIKGQRAPRLIKLTYDSFLNISDNVIRKEVSYAIIQSFYLDQQNKELLYINFMFKGETKTYILQSKNADVLRDALLDALKRYKFNIDVEMELFNDKDTDTVLDRFLNASMSRTKEFDVTKWKSVVRLDQAVKDLKKLFKKFKPVNDRADIDIEKLRGVTRELGLNFSDDELQRLQVRLDRDKKNKLTFDDMIKAWLFNKRQKVAAAKRAAARAAQGGPARRAASDSDDDDEDDDDEEDEEEGSDDE